MISRSLRLKSYKDLIKALGTYPNKRHFMPRLYLGSPPRLDFKCVSPFLHLRALSPRSATVVRENAMRVDSELRTSMALGEKLRAADEMSPELMAEILDVTCRRALLQSNAAKAQHLKDARAWTDAALALLELELPRWHIRRIAYDGGEWHCALSWQRELPDWLDQSIETRHPDLALAILIAFVEAQRAMPLSRQSVPVIPRKADAEGIPVCCENFA